LKIKITIEIKLVQAVIKIFSF